MIPLRLHIKNFLSYGSPAQVINFEPYHLICLSGKNGHGKSALLDAITWSLWGQARKAMSAARGDANLLRLGCTSMLVALDFICNNRTYRVRREYNNDSGKNMVYLDFGIYDDQTGQWRQLTGKSIRETQDSIISVIGLDGESFENSAFLRQGHSDEFSRKSPKDRKEMLANILGLGVYELLRKKSVERGKEEIIRYQNSVRTCELLKQAILPQPTVVKELELAEQQYATIDILDHEFVNNINVVRDVLQKLHSERQQLEQVLAVIAHVDKQIDRDAQELRTVWQQWRIIHKQHRVLQAKSLSKNRREEVMQELMLLQSQLQKKVELVQAVAHIQETINLHILSRQRRYEQELSPLLQQEQGYEQRKNSMYSDEQRLRAVHAEAHNTLTALEKEYTYTGARFDVAALEQEIIASEKNLEHVQARAQHANVLQHRVTCDLARSTQEKLALAEVTASCCTVCLQVIPPEHMAQVRTVREQQVSRYAQQKSRLDKKIAQYQECMKTMHDALHSLRSQHKHALALQTQHDTYHVRKKYLDQHLELLNKQLDEGGIERKKIDSEWNTCQEHIATVRKKHEREQAEDDVLKGLEQQMDACERELKLSGDVNMRYQELQKELTQIAEEEALRMRLMQEINLQTERAAHIKQRCNNLRELKRKQQERSRTCEQHAVIQQKVVVAEEEERGLQQQRVKLAQDKERLANQKGALEQTLRHINQQKGLLDQERKQAKLYEDNANDYTMLAQVLSKDGIQGMLIEHILPEIEHEANILLAKLTDNQAQIQFESLRGLKNGALKETLEIKIADSLGTRPYELFSGGEAFRIDFALRLAISKLLARRAGASVQTLIIDEGFGSQDEEGLHYIMESLYAIQHEFAKIIIVSHLPTMKDQFPTHFYVHKGVQGSTVRLMEQG